MKPDNAQFLWYNEDGLGRNTYGQFRMSCTVDAPVTEARLFLYADSVYQLFINGELIEFGPVRNDPCYPQVDEHDISAHLQEGENVIGLLVNHFGCKVYRAMPVRAAFISWGSIVTASGSIDLASTPECWSGIAAPAYQSYAPKMSFSLNAAGIVDLAKEPRSWKTVDFTEQWPAAVPLTAQDSWGDFERRSLPFMKGTPLGLGRLLHVLPIRDDETRYSFQTPVAHFYEDNKADFGRTICWHTSVYSPKAQTVRIAGFWGEEWLNGVEQTKSAPDACAPLRINKEWDLKEGWNELFGKVAAYRDVFHYYMVVPKSSGLIISADKNADTGVLFRHTTIAAISDDEAQCAAHPFPWTSTTDVSRIGGWVEARAENAAQSPCRDACYDVYAPAVEQCTVDNFIGHCFSQERYPNGFSLVFDLGRMHLAIPYLRLRGVAGAQVDVSFSEMLSSDNMHLIHTFQYNGEDRFLCSEDVEECLSPDPRGMRYINITVRGAKSDVIFEDIQLRDANYPLEQTGTFACSDAALTNIWQMGAETLKANVEDAYVDCSGRERGMYGRDTIIQMFVDMAVGGQSPLMTRCFQLYGQSPDETRQFRAVFPNWGVYTIPDFSLNMVEGFRDYWQHTGDTELIQQYWPAITKNLEWFNELADENDDLLLDSEWHTNRGVFSQYGGFHGDNRVPKGYMDNTGLHSQFTIVYMLAMRAAITLGEHLGEDVSDYKRRCNLLTESIPRVFWNDEKQCFSDNHKHTTTSVHVSLFAIRAGIVSKERLPAVLDHIRTELRSMFVNGYNPDDGAMVSPAFAFYLFDGLYQAGLEDVAENLMREGWGWCLAQGLPTCPEFFAISGGVSQSHAWSASPTWYLSRMALGVSYPDALDKDTVDIRVQASPAITWAEGAVPHPRGVVDVRWHLDDNGKRVFDRVIAPEGVRVNIVS